MSKIIKDIYKGDTRIIRLTIRTDGQIISGKLNTTLPAGIASSIEVKVSEVIFPTPPPQVGHIVLTNAARNTQTVAYTAWTISDDVYTFTVSDDLMFAFDSESTGVDIDPARVNITGATITFTAKQDPTSTTPDIQKTAILTEALMGEAVIALSSSITDIEVGEYYYDIQMVDSSGDVSTLAKSTFSILQEVTI